MTENYRLMSIKPSEEEKKSARIVLEILDEITYEIKTHHIKGLVFRDENSICGVTKVEEVEQLNKCREFLENLSKCKKISV